MTPALIGHRFLNLDYLIMTEDLVEQVPAEAGPTRLRVTMLPGVSFELDGPEADQLRERLREVVERDRTGGKPGQGAGSILPTVSLDPKTGAPLDPPARRRTSE